MVGWLAGVNVAHLPFIPGPQRPPSVEPSNQTATLPTTTQTLISALQGNDDTTAGHQQHNDSNTVFLDVVLICVINNLQYKPDKALQYNY